MKMENNMINNKRDVESVLNDLLAYEEKLIKRIINSNDLINSFNTSNSRLDEEAINLMLLNNEKNNIPLQVHKLIISHIIYQSYFKKHKIPIEVLGDFFYCFRKSIIDSLSLDLNMSDFLLHFKHEELLKILELIHINYLNHEYTFIKGNLIITPSKINLKDKGSVYTQKEIAEEIVKKTIKNKLTEGTSVNDLKILDFGCGTGIFYEAAFNFLTKDENIDKKKVILNMLFGIDIDPIAIDILRFKAFSILDSKSLEDLRSITNNIINKNMLITTESNQDNTFNVNYAKDFSAVLANSGFNVIISNPPYFLLKVNKKENSKVMKRYYEYLTTRLKEEMAFFKKSGVYKYSIEGMLNYYRLSIEMILKISSINAEIGIICPSSLFADISSKKLRRHLLLDNKLREITYFEESAKLFNNVSQAIVIFYLKKGDKTTDITIKNNHSNFLISLSSIIKIFDNNYEIPYINEMGWSILEKISTNKKLGEIKGIRNRRGELDLTFFKDLIRKDKTDYRLVRGNMIGFEEIEDKNHEYVDSNEFLAKKSEEYIKQDFNKKRLVCQQISNMSLKKRLRFVLSNEKDILANSCNYIIADDERLTKKLLFILNSLLLNWRFKITSSNNHINNYELDELPIVNLDIIPEDLNADELIKNIIVSRIYGITKEETIYLLKDHFKEEDINKIWLKLENENLQSYRPKI